MLLVFLLCNALLPVQRVVHEVHFGVAAILRESVSLNKLVNGGINAFWRWLDSWGATPTNFTLDPKHFQQVAANQDYRSLAKMCIAGLHGLHSVPSHTAYYHGIGDAWAFWIVIIQQCSVDSCVKPSHPYDLDLMNLRNILAWPGLSGRDDERGTFLSALMVGMWSRTCNCHTLMSSPVSSSLRKAKRVVERQQTMPAATEWSVWGH